MVLYLSTLWRHLLHFTLLHFASVAAIDSETRDVENSAPENKEQVARTLRPSAEGFPTATEDQHKQARRAFIESIDSDAVCALASRVHNGYPCRVVKRDSGSFNICFFVAFDQAQPEWVVRIPIEPALDDPWDKLQSEVSTLRYLERNAKIPIPHVHAYGRDARLTKNGAGTQMYIIADFIPGEPLDKRLLVGASQEHRRNFYSGLIDVFTELRRLEFPLIGSLMPDPYGSPDPVLGPVISMSAATLRRPPQRTFVSAKDYMTYQFGLISAFFSPPVCDHTVDDIKHEVFALYSMEPMFRHIIDPQLDNGPFVLNHLDLRNANIIVDENLRIQGIIDWEFAGTVPRQVFTPPSWITGHDSIRASKQMHVEFRNVLDEKSRINSACDRLRREWYGQLDAGLSNIDQIDMAFCVAHVLRRPIDITDIFYDFFANKLSDKDLDATISEFFDKHQSLASEVQRRAEQCERYTQYLITNGLYETDVDKLLAESKALKEKWGWSSGQ